MKTSLIKATVIFVLTAVLCSLLVGISVVSRIKVERLTMEQLITEKGAKANEVISRLLYKAHTLSAIITQDGGEIDDFELIASTIMDDPSILNILIAPNGVVTKVYPLHGNEAVIGLDFFSEGEGNKEAAMAKETGQLVFGGPFNLVQGGQALVGRLPVYTDNKGQKEFWGLVSVTLKYPQVLDGAGLTELNMQGFDYEIWRINPDDNEKQIIAGSSLDSLSRSHFIEKQIMIHNTEWYLRISPIRAWYEYPETWLMIILSLGISFLVAFVVYGNSELRLLKSKFENMAQTDSLTGISNRRHFMELAMMQLERTERLGSDSFIIFFDIDKFKEANDTYGHQAGDRMLEEITRRVRNTIRPYDLFARYGGEEFIILALDISRSEIEHLTERVRENICNAPIEVDDMSIPIAASFGIARAESVGNLETAIGLADKALYKAKEAGGNKVVFHERGDMGDTLYF